MPSNTRVAVDAMGGDFAPIVCVAGALAALERTPGLSVILVGAEPAILAELPDGLPTGLSVVHADDVVEMHESPVEAVRRKDDTSIARAVQLVADGRADALVSAGNTGGVVAAASFGLPRLPGVRRAGIAAPFPTRTGHCVIIDVGANPQARPGDLVQYAVMGAEYTRAVVGTAVPRAGLLAIGEEEAKGEPRMREAFDALGRLPGIDFVGNVEGQQIFAGDLDVIVCEGFVGNVILKASEGLLDAFVHHMLGRLSATAGNGDDATVTEALDDLRHRTDYTRYGGAPLMGHEGAIVICHGRSPASAIANAIAAADTYVRDGVNERIAHGLAALEDSDSGDGEDAA